MSMQDTISDLLTHIRNAQMVKKTFVTISSSINKIAILKVLKEEGYIKDFIILDDNAKKLKLKILLKYFDGKAVISKITRVSKPGLRIYKKKVDLPKVLGGLGIAIVSTSQGVMTDYNARKLGYGGEVLCFVE